MDGAKQVLDAAGIEKAVVRMAHEILEKSKSPKDLALVGIQTRGVALAGRLQKALQSLCAEIIPLGSLDINLYRDDIGKGAGQPMIRKTEIDFEIDDLVVILVDDVLYTGRTIRSAMNALVDFGRPKRIELAVLVDRGHRELPIRADFVGKNIPTQETENVNVRLLETDSQDEVTVENG